MDPLQNAGSGVVPPSPTVPPGSGQPSSVPPAQPAAAPVSPPAQPAGTQVTDQVLRVNFGGQEREVRTSDIFDDGGVPYRNRVSEAQRRAEQAEQALAETRAQMLIDGSFRPSTVTPPTVPGQPTQPGQLTGGAISDDQINQMILSGQGAEAIRILFQSGMSQFDVKRMITNTMVAQDNKSKAVRRYPDLGNPNSEFFRRVAFVMDSNGMYDNPGGIMMACATVAEDMRNEGRTFATAAVNGSTPPVVGPEAQRLSHTTPGVVPGSGGGGTSAPVTQTYQLDEAGQEVAAKLGIDPNRLAGRLATFMQRKYQGGV